MKTLMLSTCALALSSFFLVQMSTEADARSRYKKRGMGVSTSQNTTGGRGRTISRGPTGADTVNTNSAAGGNSSQPSRAIGTGSAGGGGAGGS